MLRSYNRLFSTSSQRLALKCIQLNQKQCRTYALFDTLSSQSLLIDPTRENIALYISFLAYHSLRLLYVVDSHSHADHFSAAFQIKDLTGAKYVMSKFAPAPLVDIHVEDGGTLKLGEEIVEILHTPGHTPDSISLYCPQAGLVFTGDTLLIGGCGRTDFSGGNPAHSYDSITKKLFTLPDHTIVYPAHDYRFNTSSTIIAERTTNPRLAGKSKSEFVDIMDNLGLPLPEKIMEALQINTSASQDDEIANLPTYSQLTKVKSITPVTLKLNLSDPNTIVIDVREVDEFNGAKLPRIEGSLNYPLKGLVGRVKEMDAYKEKTIVVVCRAGVRSVTAASILGAYGFENVVNLSGGLLGWDYNIKM